MEGSQEAPYTYRKGDVESFANKLQSFADGLAPEERQVLERILVRASTMAEEEKEVQGFILEGPRAQPARSFGFGSPFTNSIARCACYDPGRTGLSR